jgi:hypothetical protein
MAQLQSPRAVEQRSPRKRTNQILLSGSILALGSLVVVTPAYASQTLDVTGADAIAIINDVAPEVLSTALPASKSVGGMDVSLESGTMTVTEDAQVQVILPEVELTIELPKAGAAELEDDPNAITFDNGDGTTTSVFGNEGDAVSAVTTISGESDPTSFPYTYAGIDEIREADDGGLTLWKDGENVGFFFCPGPPMRQEKMFLHTTKWMG